MGPCFVSGSYCCSSLKDYSFERVYGLYAMLGLQRNMVHGSICLVHLVFKLLGSLGYPRTLGGTFTGGIFWFIIAASEGLSRYIVGIHICYVYTYMQVHIYTHTYSLYMQLCLTRRFVPYPVF